MARWIARTPWYAWLASVVLLLLGGTLPAASDSSSNYVRRMLDPTPDPPYFGFDVAVSGSTVVVGASRAAYVFARVPGGWRQQARLVAPDRARRPFFGREVAIDGDTIVVSTIGPFDGTLSAAHVFVRAPGTTEWSLQATLESPPEGVLFGAPLAIQGDVIAVGGGEFGHPERGRVFVWSRQGSEWELEDSFAAPVGETLALSGNTLAMGEPTAPPNFAGAVHVFVRAQNGWREQAVLRSPDLDHPPGGNQFSFGTGIALDGNTLLASATAGSPRFRTYVFVRRGEEWRHQATLIDPQSQPHGFGSSVALDGNQALIGAIGGPSRPSSFGIGYVYRRSGRQWQLTDQLIAPQSHASNNFGPVVALSGSRAALVPGPQGGSEVPPGAAYVFERRLSPGDEVATGLPSFPAPR